MADRKITGHTAITAANLDKDTDQFEVVDVSDTTDAATGTNKKITPTEVQNLATELGQTPGTDQTANGFFGTVTVDVNATGIGALLHRDADGNYIEADADGATTMPVTAIALEAGTGSKKVLFMGFYRDDTAFDFTPGAVLYASTTAGAITETAPTGSGDQVQVVGIAVSADVIHFNPSPNLIELV